MDLNKRWLATVTTLTGASMAVSWTPERGFGWHAYDVGECRLASARDAAEELLELYGEHIGWQEGEDLLRRCKLYDGARRLQSAA